MTLAAMKATVAAIPAIRPMVDQANALRRRPRRVSPLNRELRVLEIWSASAWRAATVSGGAVGGRRGHGGLGGPLVAPIVA